MISPVNPALSPDKLFYKGDETFAFKGFRGLNTAGKLKFGYILFSSWYKVSTFHRKALKQKECYIGPFWGEFGNFLLHFLPYVSYLHKNGVKLHICCLENYLPFLIDDKGQKIYEDCIVLRDFFAEVRPSGNKVDPPADIKKNYEEFKGKALQSGKAFLDLSDADLYWYVFRNWQLDGRQYLYPIENTLKDKTAQQNNAVIFPRKKGAAYTPNNGESWDYMKLAKSISPYFDNVFITGHPLMSSEIKEEGNIRACLSTDNRVIMQCCANSSLILTQHSGAMHMGHYVNVPVLLIFKGTLPIKGLDDSNRFIKNIQRQKVYIAIGEDEVIDFVKHKTVAN